MPGLTRDKLLRELFRILSSPRATVTARNLNPKHKAASVEWESGGPIAIKVDGDQCGMVTAAIHETLHVYLDRKLEWASGDLEETMIDALERDLHEYLRRRPKAYEKWRDVIQDKLAGPDDE